MNLPTPIALLQDKGVIGEILRQIRQSSHTVLEEAETKDDPWTWLAKWCKRNPVIHWHDGTKKMRDTECATLEKEGFKQKDIGVYVATKKRPTAKVFQGVREVRFNFHKHDPEKIIMRVEMDGCWPDSFRKTFEAAASQRKAFNVLAQVARDGGSISNHDRHLKILTAEKRGDRQTVERLTKKHLASILQTVCGRRWLLENKEKALVAPPEMREWARREYEILYAADVRHLGRKPADEKWKSTKTPRYKMSSNYGDYIAAAMTTEWLVGGSSGFPGLCFMSDELLAKLLGYTLPLPSLLSDSGLKLIVTIRQRIGLKKAEILFNGIEQIADKKWAILNLRREKTHSITFLPDKLLPPIL